ncbi:MAG: hypothetical protein ABEL76_12340 [Bradymonadaceae bacterium]
MKWTRELTGRGDEFASALAFDERDDRLFLVGTFLQQIEGTPSRGKRDAFVATIDRAGSSPRVRTFGTPEKELGKRLAIPPRTGAPVVCGLTGGDLIGGGHRGYHDGYLLRLPAR